MTRGVFISFEGGEGCGKSTQIRRVAERLESLGNPSSSAIPDRMENQPAAFYDAVREGYLRLARETPERVRLLDASQPEEAIFSEIWKLLASRLSGRAS